MKAQGYKAKPNTTYFCAICEHSHNRVGQISKKHRKYAVKMV